MGFVSAEKDKISIKEIILEHLKEVLKITRLEFRGGYYEKKVVGGIIEENYVPDSRKQYIQVVESLSDILLPYFDKDMEKEYKELMKTNDKNLEEFEKSKGDIGSLQHNDYIIKKLRLMRTMFQQLNLLLHRKDYLKGKIYTEGLDDDDDEESD